MPLSPLLRLNSSGAAVVLVNRYYYEKNRERLDGLGSPFPRSVGTLAPGFWQEGEFVQKQELSPGVRDYFEAAGRSLPSAFVKGTLLRHGGARLGSFVPRGRSGALYSWRT